MAEQVDKFSRLRREALQLRRVSAAAASAYEAERDTMLPLVDRKLIEREDLQRLIGNNPIALMRLNHSNHALFMANVFRYSCFGLFAQVLVWVYRAYRHHGFAGEYFPIELAAWRAAVSECLAPPVAAEIDAVYAWMLERHEELMQLATPAALEAERQDAAGVDCEALVQELLQGDYAAAVERMRPQLRDVDDLAAFYQDSLQPALLEVGRRWERGLITVADEHLATAVAERMLATAYVAMTDKLPATTHGSAVIATAPDESHGVGGRMVADLLELQGWDVHFLGVDLPVADVAALVGKLRPTFVGVSLVMPYNLMNTERLIAAVRAACPESPPRILLGSSVLGWDQDLWRQLGADAFAPDLQTALVVADGWR